MLVIIDTELVSFFFFFKFTDSGGPPLSTKQIRSITILREIPFVVPFNTRVGIFQGLLAADRLRFVKLSLHAMIPKTKNDSNLIYLDKHRAQGDQQGFLQGPSIQLVVRRSHLYEDAFDKLRPENGMASLRNSLLVKKFEQN